MNYVPTRLGRGFLCIVSSLGLATLAGDGEKAAQEEEAVFSMREVSAFEKNTIAPSYSLARGAYARCFDEPDKEVKAYPKLNSKHPLYGKLKFDRDLVRRETHRDSLRARRVGGGPARGR